jgi:hypothetical protein
LRRALPILAVLSVLACGGSSDPRELTDAGAAALNSGDPKKALSDFDRALEHMDPSHPEFPRASFSRCQALAGIDPARAKDEFLKLARIPAARVAEPEFTTIAMDLVMRHAIGPATEVAETGLRMYPESPAMKTLLDKVGDAAKKANDPEAVKKLKSLGYAGDG